MYMDETDKTLQEIDEKARETDEIPRRLPVLPLRDVVIFPHMIFPILIGRESSLKSVSKSLEKGKFIFLTSQLDSETDEPGKEDLNTHGTVAKIIQLIRLPNNLIKILVDGINQGVVKRFVDSQQCLEADIEMIDPVAPDETDTEFEAMMRHASELFEGYIKANSNIPPEAAIAFKNLDDPVRKLYYAAANLLQDTGVKQRILNAETVKEQFFALISILTSEIEVLSIEKDIDSRVHETLQKAQRRFFIQEQIRALQQELGDDEEAQPELAKLRQHLEDAQLPEGVKEKVFEEFGKLRKMPAMSPEFGVIRNYLDWVKDIPWHEETQDNLDLDHVRKVLDKDHYGLDFVKERLLEHVAVLKLTSKPQGSILCLTGPPGTGKTSLAKSIARAFGRKFVRIALGGIRDEAEIRGHRRTYIGSMPGKIIQAMKRAGTVNPVILLDEIDKMSADFRGDPSAALLEVLDPEQNSDFMDHYLDVEYDLSKVLFITTSNVKYNIPGPLLDRMEVIELSSYLKHEKLEIARRHLLPRQKEANGLSDFNVSVPKKTLSAIVSGYTKEAGVRNLERMIGGVLRKVALEFLEGKHDKSDKVVVTPDSLNDYLKSPFFIDKKTSRAAKVGLVNGLAWTAFGGDTLEIEINVMPGKEKLSLTGKLGDVMKESAHAALTYVRSNADFLGVDEDFFSKSEIHIHIPEGAIPKDGPSAGITMTMALISALSKRKVRGTIAMTGEVTLRGNILRIGGLKEKLVAAKAAGIKTVLVPADNASELDHFEADVTKGLEIHSVDNIKDALPIVFPGEF